MLNGPDEVPRLGSVLLKKPRAAHELTWHFLTRTAPSHANYAVLRPCPALPGMGALLRCPGPASPGMGALLWCPGPVSPGMGALLCCPGPALPGMGALLCCPGPASRGARVCIASAHHSGLKQCTHPWQGSATFPKNCRGPASPGRTTQGLRRNSATSRMCLMRTDTVLWWASVLPGMGALLGCCAQADSAACASKVFVHLGADNGTKPIVGRRLSRWARLHCRTATTRHEHERHVDA